MTSRLLPPTEYDRLAGTLLEHVVSDLDPVLTRVMVVEDAGAVVGCFVLTPLWHAEGLWIAPDHPRRAGIARRLWTGLHRLVQAFHVRSVMTAAMDERVVQFWERAGAVPLPAMTHLIVPEGSRLWASR